MSDSANTTNTAASSAADTTIELLATAATAQFGPLGGLVVKLGAPLALDAVSKRLKGKALAEATVNEIMIAARDLLSTAPSFSDAVKAGEGSVGTPK